MTAPEEPQNRPLPIARSWADTPTLWQRFWRSPWTHLVLAVYFTWVAWSHKYVWYLTVLFVAYSIFAWLDFWNKADDRWGKP